MSHEDVSSLALPKHFQLRSKQRSLSFHLKESVRCLQSMTGLTHEQKIDEVVRFIGNDFSKIITVLAVSDPALVDNLESPRQLAENLLTHVKK